jgi:hypothetical protein
MFPPLKQDNSKGRQSTQTHTPNERERPEIGAQIHNMIVHRIIGLK